MMAFVLDFGEGAPSEVTKRAIPSSTALPGFSLILEFIFQGAFAMLVSGVLQIEFS